MARDVLLMSKLVCLPNGCSTFFQMYVETISMDEYKFIEEITALIATCVNICFFN